MLAKGRDVWRSKNGERNSIRRDSAGSNHDVPGVAPVGTSATMDVALQLVIEVADVIELHAAGAL